MVVSDTGRYRVFFVFGLVFLAALFWACSSRFLHIYLEDDFLWCLPLIEQIKHTQALPQMVHSFNAGELSLFDGIYFSLLLSMFGDHLQFYVFVSLAVHLCNAGLLFHLLFKRMRMSWAVSFFAAAIYLTFYGHFHAYMRPISISHTMVVSLILLLSNLYLGIEQRRENNQRIRRLYAWAMGTAVIACVMRLSIVIVPLIMFMHMWFTAKNGKDAWRKFCLWGPVIFILLIYQWVLLTVVGRQGRTLDGIMGVFNSFVHPVSLMLSLLMYFLLSAVTTGGFYLFFKSATSEVFLKKFKKIIPWAFVFPLFFLLCLFNWLMALPSAHTADAYQRWQLMAYPEGARLFVLLLLSWVMMVAFTRHAIARAPEGIIFVIWYLGLLPFLGWQLDPVPSRYLIYISPIFATVLSFFLFEVLPQRFKFFREHLGRWVMVGVVCIFIFSNIYAIRVRLTRSVLGDYLWSYDYVKAANLINDHIQANYTNNEIRALSVCVQGVDPIPFLDGWKSFLGDHFDPNASFVMTLRSRIGEVKDIHVNRECQNNDVVFRITDKTVVDQHNKSIELFYRFFDQAIVDRESGNPASVDEQLRHAFEHPPFVITLFSPEPPDHVVDLIKQAYTRFYIDDPKYLRIEYMIQKEVLDYEYVASYVRGKPVLISGPSERWDKLEEYRGYSFFWGKGHYFAIPGEAVQFDLAKFKRGGYPVAQVAATKYELRQKIPHSQYLAAGINYASLPQPSGKGVAGHFQYQILFLGIPVGQATLDITPDDVNLGQQSVVMQIKPCGWVQKLSGNRAGLAIVSRVDTATGLPLSSEENTFDKIKKGKKGRSIIYHHDDLYMERRIYKEDIFPDTRDLGSLTMWLMTRDYKTQKLFQSTMNISRNMYMVTAEADGDWGENPYFGVNVSFVQVDHGLKPLKSVLSRVRFLRQHDRSMPVSIHLKVFFIPLTLRLI